MNTVQRPSVLIDPARILERHANRRNSGVPTVSMLVGPVGAAGRAWRSWASAARRSVVVAHGNYFPTSDWIRSIVEQVDLPAAAVQCLAQRAGREPDSFLSVWQTTTSADRERFRHALTPGADDDLLHAIAGLAVAPNSWSSVAAGLSGQGDQIVPLIVRLASAAPCPAVLFHAGSKEDFPVVGAVAVKWAMGLPALPIAVAVPLGVWADFCAIAPESRVKAILREGEIAISGIDPESIERILSGAGTVGSAATALAAVGADTALVESAAGAARAAAVPPATSADDGRARSAAERFLFAFLESLPETAGRFELNASLDFPFGPRPAEVDLLCRSPRIAIELDGYFHFIGPDGYRRDRTKDWELQQRGYFVLRFLAEDVLPQIEVIRDRILTALTVTRPGATL